MRKLLLKTKYLFLAALMIFSGSLSHSTAMAITDPLFFSRNDILHYDDECLDFSATAAVHLAGEDNLEKILNFFMQKGLTLAQAAGIVGNMQQESGLKPDIEQGGRIVDENYTPINGVGFGLVQWTFTARQKPLQDFIAGMGVPITDLSGQLGFVWEELNTGWLGTLNKLRAIDDPVEAAVLVHNEYEISADSAATVRQVRGGFAQEVYDKYKDAPALAGSTADPEMANPVGSLTGEPGQENRRFSNAVNSCNDRNTAGGSFEELLLAYAWEDWRGLTIDARQEYRDAVAEAQLSGHYIGGISHPGIDCGGFITLLIRNSNYDSGYNYDGKGGNTTMQERWMRENWEPLGSSTEIDASTLQPGDVAINSTHTFIYVGEVDGFGSDIASASLDERAPMADTMQSPTQPGYNWYRIGGTKT